MLSNFSWLQYGTFTLVSMLVHYSVILLLYYRQEIRSYFGSVSGKGGSGGGTDPVAESIKESDLMGKVALEDGMSSVAMDELDFGGNDQLLQGELADCMEELNYTLSVAKEKKWDTAKLKKSFVEIAECYVEVFGSKLRPQILEYISTECRDQLDWKISVQELETLLSGSTGTGLSGKILAVGVALLAFLAQVAYSQDGNQGIAEATNKVAGYFDTGTDLMYAIGAIMGLVGAVKVYSKWNAGEPDTAKVATAWFGSCIFLVVVATVLKSFFGI